MQKSAIPYFAFFSGPYSKIHVSSPVIKFFKKFLSLWMRSRRWRRTSFRLSFCLIVRFLGTNLAHNFFMANSSVKIWWTVVWFKFNSLAIIRTVSRGSDRTRAPTISILLSVFEVLPERGSPLMDSWGSENALKHLNTCDLNKHALRRPVSVYWKFQCRFPQVWHKTWSHIVARNCALPFPWHTHENCFTRNCIKISVLKLARWN